MRDINPGDSLVQRPNAALAGMTDDSAIQTGNRPPSFNQTPVEAAAMQAIQHMAAQIGAAQMQQPPVSATSLAAAVTAATPSPTAPAPTLLLPAVQADTVAAPGPAAATTHAALLKTQPVSSPPPTPPPTTQPSAATTPPLSEAAARQQEAARHHAEQMQAMGRGMADQTRMQFSMGSGSLSREQLTTGFGFGLAGPTAGVFSGAGGPYMGGGEVSGGEAGYGGRMEQTWQAQADGRAVRAALAANNTAQAEAILRGNPDVGVSVNGSAEVYGEAAVQEVARQAAARQAPTTRAAAGTAPPHTPPGLVPELPHLRQPQVVLSELPLPPAPSSTAQSTQPFVDVADVGELPPAASGSQTLAARNGGVDQGALRRWQVEQALASATGASTEATSTQATSASTSRPQTAAERQVVEQAIADGAEGGRVYSATPGQAGVDSWSQPGVTPQHVGQAVYVQAGISQGMRREYAEEFARLVEPHPHVRDGDWFRPMTQADLQDRRVVPTRYEGTVGNDMLEAMRQYQAGRERGLSAAAAAGLVMTAGRLPGMALGGGGQVGVLGVAGGVATTLGTAAPVGIALSTLAAPVLIVQHMVNAGRVQIEVDEVLPPMWMTPTAELPASPPPSQPMPPLPPVPPLMDTTPRVSSTVPPTGVTPDIQTSTPPFSAGQMPPPPLITTPMMDDELRRLITDPLLIKPINLPAWDKITLDMEHILSGHIEGGHRAVQSEMARGTQTKDFFPEWMTEAQIERAIRDAYNNSKKVKTTEDTITLEGSAAGMLIRMYLEPARNNRLRAHPVGSGR